MRRDQPDAGFDAEKVHVLRRADVGHFDPFWRSALRGGTRRLQSVERLRRLSLVQLRLELATFSASAIDHRRERRERPGLSQPRRASTASVPQSQNLDGLGLVRHTIIR
jgi:hypothetical protein